MGVIPTYVKGLDEALGGGIPEGSIVLLSGSPGTMKTSLAFSILYHNSKFGRRGFYITLEERGDDLKATMKKMGMGNVNQADLYLLDLGRIRLELSDGETKGDWFAILKEIIEDAVSVSDYSLVVLDSLDSLYSLEVAPHPRRQLFHLFGYLKDFRVTTLVVSEIPFGSPRLTEHGVDFLADGILLMRQFELGESDIQLRVRCVKMRKLRHDRSYYSLEFDEGRFVATRSITD